LPVAFDPDWLVVVAPDRDASEGVVDWAFWFEGVALCEEVELCELCAEEFDEAAGADEGFELV